MHMHIKRNEHTREPKRKESTHFENKEAFSRFSQSIRIKIMMLLRTNSPLYYLKKSTHYTHINRVVF